jgi:hypothetical protein
MSCGLEGIDLLFTQKLARVGKTSPDVLFGKVRIARQDLRVTPTGREQLHHQLDGDSRAAHDRFTGQDLRIKRRCDQSKPQENDLHRGTLFILDPRNSKSKLLILGLLGPPDYPDG